MTGGQQIKDHPDIDSVQLGAGMPFSSQVDKTRFPLEVGVVSASDPFEITRQVVEFHAVYVIDGRPLEFTRHEGASNQTVHKELATRWADLLADGEVSALPSPRRYDLGPLSLRDGATGPDSGCNPVKSSDAAKRRDDENNIALFHLAPFFIRSRK